ncbi:hypothetical protein GIB67_032374 [Kingdonia uniflora]|uniref:Exportin-4 n=1 Tax=Kingdonia uniflora TaxID=39325 RepID=A0A7J7MIW5_9MAGN|nr:hypothetical protein GIB67_032374 [Kingdonia uniflora]
MWRLTAVHLHQEPTLVWLYVSIYDHSQELRPFDLQPTDTGKDSALPPDGIAAAATVFNLIIESELKVAAASAFDDEDDSGLLQPSVSAMDERLSSYALIARAAVEITIPLLSRLFSERFILLHQGRGVCDPTRTLEELYSLLLITGHILADEGDGETPMIPDALQNHFLDILEADHHPVVVLSSSIIKFAEQSLNPEIREALFSPRLMEAVIWFLARWSGTYLMPQEFIMATNCTEGRDHDNQHVSLLARKALVSFCGEHNQGKAILDTIVRISMATLSSYPGEKDLQSLTCYQLLSALVRRKKVCVHLVTLDSWNNLANAFANERSLFSLTSPHQRSLAETLVRSASGMKSSEISNQYVRELMGQMAAFLVDLSSKNDLKTVADAIYSVCCLLERLRGAATATEPRTQKALYDMGVSVMNSILTLLEIYKHESAVVSLLLKFVVDWVDGQIVFLEVKETSVVVNFCMRLLQLYSSHNIGKLSLSLSSSLLREEKTDKYKDLRALLQLLTSLCSKDLVDFSTNSNEAESMDIPQVVYFGLHIVTPLISLEMLKYPKLCYDYFTLLSHMLEVYPEKVAQLNTEAFVHILGSLEFGIHNQAFWLDDYTPKCVLEPQTTLLRRTPLLEDTEVVNMCLGALNALASYHYKERAAGKAGLGSHAQTGKSQEGVLSRFLQSLLHLLLFEDYSADLVGSAAAALFGLILCEQGVYQRLGHELIERQATPDLKSRLANALQALTSSNQLSSSLDRLNHQIFRNNLYGFLTEVRGFLRTI